MTLLFEDTFNRADGAPGNDWTVASGTWDISTNQLRCHTAGARILRTVPAGAETDILIDAVTGPGQQWVSADSLVFWLRSDANRTNCYKVQFGEGIAGIAYALISVVVNGAETNLGRYYQFALTGGVHHWGAQCYGGIISALIDGVTIGQVVDVSIPNGSLLHMSGVQADHFFIDTFDIYSPQASQMSLFPSVVLPNIAGLQITLIGIGTTWTPGTPGSPTFTASAGTITAQTVETATIAVLTYTSPPYGCTVTFTDPATGRTALLLVNSSPVVPYSWLGLPDWLIKALTEIIAPEQAILGILGYYATNNYISRIANELGVDADTVPTAGHVKAALAAVQAALAELDTDSTGPDSVRHLLLSIQASAIDTDTNVGLMSNLNTLTLQDVLDAIAEGGGGGGQAVLDAISALSDLVTTVLAEEYVIDGNPNTHTITEVLQAIADLTIPDMTQLAADVASILSKVDAMDGDGSTNLPAVLAAVAALWQSHDKGLWDIYGKANDAAGNANDAKVAIGALATAWALWLAAEPEKIAAQTAAIIAGVGALTGATDALITALTGAVEGYEAAVTADMLTIQGQYNALKGELDTVKAEIEALHAGPPAYPGALHTLPHDPDDIAENMVINRNLDGFFYALTVVPKETSHKYVGDYDTMKFLGWAAFLDDGGRAERFQSLSWNTGLITPVSTVHPKGVVIHWQTGAQGTVTTYTITG